ncbi:hypothetical protein MMC19_002063 [Ptychographa xylographoides]|nr:hypothetical protein [Ptychographa xylographoides]
MPGRQSTGPASQKRPKARKQKTQKRSLNALAIAEQQVPRKLGIRKHRLGEAEPDNTKRKRDVSEEDSGDGAEGGQNFKRPRAGDKDRFGNEIEGGSDSEGNEWVTGQVASDDDSDLDSDEAMGESDEERFEGFVFRGSSSATTRNKSRDTTSAHPGAVMDGEEIDLDEEKGDNIDSDNESDAFREEAIDLAAMLDISDDEPVDKPSGRGAQTGDLRSSHVDEEGRDSSSDDQESTLSFSDMEDETGDAAKLNAIQTLVSSLGNGDSSIDMQKRHQRDAQEAASPSEYGLNPRQKLTIADLLPTINDPQLRKSLKILDDDSKDSRKRSNGIPQKLDVPLAKRQQDRLDRAAAYEKSKETLSRWIDTVKHNRRAEHLSFPLPDPDALSAKDTKRMLSNTQSKPLTSLELTIESILTESGLAPVDGKSQEDQLQEFEELALNKVPIEEVQARRAELRRARELLFREEIRAKRIKKIKSKSYRRVHRKERERNALREKDVLAANGVQLSEDEQDQTDKRRAEERMGARHRESKWAKAMKDSGRATWDEDARSGVTEMAKRGEELRRRIAGKGSRGEDDGTLGSSSESSAGEELSDDDNVGPRAKYLENKIYRLGAKAQTESMYPESRLSSMKFMQKAEATRKGKNDADVEKLRRNLAGEDSLEEEEVSESAGRRTYGPNKTLTTTRIKENPFSRSEFEEKILPDDEDEQQQPKSTDSDTEIIVDQTSHENDNQLHPNKGKLLSRTSKKTTIPQKHAESEENPWLSLNLIKSNNRDRRNHASDEVLISSNPKSFSRVSESSDTVAQSASTLKDFKQVKTKKSSPTRVRKTSQVLPDLEDNEDASFTGFSSPEPSTPPSPKLTNQDLINRAFAGDDVLATFSAEKAGTALSEAPQEISTALPGWGAWTGEGISKRELRRIEANRENNKDKNTMTIPGIDPMKRKDAKLERVIVNEKRVKKNAKYLASQLPYPYENRAQYERSLRLPVGPEWTTKEVFQRATMPRVLMKQGIIAPMEKPMV